MNESITRHDSGDIYMYTFSTIYIYLVVTNISNTILSENK